MVCMEDAPASNAPGGSGSVVAASRVRVFDSGPLVDTAPGGSRFCQTTASSVLRTESSTPFSGEPPSLQIPSMQEPALVLARACPPEEQKLSDPSPFMSLHLATQAASTLG